MSDESEKKRVVIVEDSATMRGLVRRQLMRDGRFIVVGEAADPFEARDVIKRTSPDVLTLDVEMPRMDGLSFLEKLMRLRPMPVVMFSSETHRGSAAAIEALSLGAIDCIGKPTTQSEEALQALADRVFVAANARLPGRRVSAPEPPSGFEWNGRIVLIGASTGGVDALECILAAYPENCPPTLIAQHMPETFLASFARFLSDRYRPDIRLAQEGEMLRPGMVRIAPGGDTHLLASKYGRFASSRLHTGEKVSGHRPSVDVLFRSATGFAGEIIAVILTGMGCDGARGMKELRDAGAFTLAQDRESSVVYGMPRVAAELGGVCKSVSLREVAGAILDATSRKGTAEAAQQAARLRARPSPIVD